MIPGLKEIFNANPVPQFKTLADVVSGFFNIAFYIAAFLAFFWFVWGAFQYIFAGGDKEKLGRARSRITWAIIGLIIVALAFTIAQFVAQILQPKPGHVPLPGITLVSPAYAQAYIEKEFGFGNVGSLSEGVDRLVIPAFSIATSAVVIYFLIGAFKFLTSGGDKEAVSSARAMITHAIIGFVLLMFAFLIFQFVLSNLLGITAFKIIGGP